MLEENGHEVAPEGRPRRAGMIGLGIAGGLTPSPTALLVLLGATAAGHPWTGVVAVLAFGAGMALTLAGVGLGVGLVGEGAGRWGGAGLRRWSSRWSSRWPARGARPVGAGANRWGRLLPLAPSLAVVAAGSVLTVRGLVAAVGVAL